MELAILSSITAAAPSLHRGWNLGNTLDEPKMSITTSPPTLHRGWNLGDTLDTTQYNPGVNAPWVFDAVKKAGFDWVRIPVHWDPHTSHTPPFAINATWMQTVIETVTWAHASGLVAMVNTHHENWFDNTTTFDSNLPRFLAIWSQIAETFKAVPDSQLVFELLNEPSNIKIDQLNAMNAAVLPVVRKTNPTRQVHFGGLAKMGSWWILQHPDAITIPENDGHLALTVHSYDPYAFAGPGPKTPSGGHIPLITTFTATDAAKGVATMKFLGEWGRNRSMPVVHDEFGCTVMQPNRTARLLYYKTYARAAEAAGVAWAVWDDDGWFQILRRRGNRTWDAEVLAQLVPPSNAAEEPAAGAQCTPYSATGIDYADANLSVVPATDGWPGCCKACTAFGTQCKVAVYLKDESLCTLKATAKKPVKAHHVVAVSMGPPPTPPPPNPSAMDLYIIPQKVADAAGAKCLDGTPPAFYYRAANTSADASASSKYVLYFKGGGWCYNETSCAARAGGIIGSSQNLNKSQPTFTSEGPLDAIAAANPEFANWHHIELWYCDGGSFSGDLDNSVSVDGKEIWFRGRRNLATILDHLNEETFGDLSKATDVLLSGGSAGGLSSYLHADYVHSRFDQTKVKFGVAPISGFFLYHDTVAGVPKYIDEMRYVFNMMNSSGGVNQKCVDALGNDASWRCIFANASYSFIEAPIFPLNSAVDSWQMGNVFDMDPGCTKQLAPFTQFDNCSKQQLIELNGYAADFMDDMQRSSTFTRPGNGGFIESCLEHVTAQGGGYDRVEIDGVSMQEALTAWWRAPASAPAAAHWKLPCKLNVDSAPHQCNPTCGT